MIIHTPQPEPSETPLALPDRIYNSGYRLTRPLQKNQVLPPYTPQPPSLIDSHLDLTREEDSAIRPDPDDLTTRAQTLASLTDYLSDLALNPDLARTTIEKYAHNLRSFTNWLGGSPISNRTARTFLAYLQEKGYSRSSIVSYYHAIKPFLEFLGIPIKVKFRKRRHLPQYHSPDNLASILDVINSRTDSWARLAERDALIVLTLAFTGLRRAELLNLRPCDIAGGKLLIRSGKGDKDRVVSLVPALAEALPAYIKKHQIKPTDSIFPLQPGRIYKIVKQAALRAGITDISPHTLRHYFATRLVEGGAQLKAIQELLGHADLSTTAVYLDIVASHLDDAVNVLSAEAQSLSLSVPLNNRNLKRIDDGSESLSLSLSNEQPGREAPCNGLKSPRARPSTPQSTWPQSRPSSSTGPGSEASSASARDAPSASPASPNAGATRPAPSSTAHRTSGSSGNRYTPPSRTYPMRPAGPTSPSPGQEKAETPVTTSPAGSPTNPPEPLPTRSSHDNCPTQ